MTEINDTGTTTALAVYDIYCVATRELTRFIAGIDLSRLSPDTVMSMGYAAGAIEKVLALVGRDLDRMVDDDNRKLSATVEPLRTPQHGEWWVCVHPQDVQRHYGDAQRVPTENRLIAHYREYFGEPPAWELTGATTAEKPWRNEWLVPLFQVNLANPADA